MFLRELFEAPKTAVFAFGRMNPPTIGHAKLVDVVKSQDGKPFLFLTHTQKPKTDPLSFAEKVFFAQKSFTGIEIGNQTVKTIIDAMKHLEKAGYTDIIYVAGSDRVASFEKLLNDYNGKDYNFNSINIVSAGQRDPDAEGAEGMSASKLKAAAAEGDFETFKTGVAGDEKLAQMMYNKVRAGMGIEESLQELVVKQQKPKLDVLNNIASRSDGKPFPLSWNADSNEITVGGKIYVAPKEANKFMRFYDNQEKENQELMNKALQSASKTANLFKNIGIDFVWKQNEGEVRDKYCSPKCCGADVKAEDCACKPDCPHCNCNKKELDENFADGKKKGKSRPGRVKRSGASCKGSVTDLRAKAKKASGEKAKMYHWCANMKSGRKK